MTRVKRDNQVEYLGGGKFKSKPIYTSNASSFAIAQSRQIKVFSATRGEQLINLPQDSIVNIAPHPTNSNQVCVSLKVFIHTHTIFTHVYIVV
jgi:hypothetical protein